MNKAYSIYHIAILVLTILSYSNNTIGQEVIKVIEFDSDDEVETFGPTGMEGECDNNQGVFGIENGAFVIREKEGGCCNLPSQVGNNFNLGIIGPIVFNQSYCNVTVTMVISAIGDMEDCIGLGLCPSDVSGPDELQIFAELNDGNQLISSYCGNNSTGPDILQYSTVEVGSVLLFNITGGTQEVGEEYRIESITIEGTPKSLVTAQINSNIPDNRFCEGTDVLVLNAQPADGVDYDWVGPQGQLPSSSSSVAFNNTVSQAEEGLYSVTITEDGGCTSTAEIQIEVIGLDEKDEEVRFPFIANSYCENETVQLPTDASDGRTVIWEAGSEINLMGLSDPVSLFFAYNDNQQRDTIFLRVDTLPIVGTNLDSMDICARSDMPFLNLVELLDLNLDNISTTFAFGSGRNKNELFNLDVTGIPPGQDNISITSIPNGNCGEETYFVNIMFELIEVGRDNIITLCERAAQIDSFPDFSGALGLTNNAVGVWRDVNSTGIDLSSPSSVDLSTLETGSYDFQYIVNTQTICGETIEDTALLRLEIVPDLSLNITTRDIELTCENLSEQIDFDFEFPGSNYMVDIQIVDEDGNTEIYGPYESVEELHFINVAATDGVNRIEGKTLLLNSALSSTYTISVVSFDADINTMCPIETPTGEVSLTFNNLITLDIDTSLCEGETFILDEVEYTSNTSDQVFIAGSNGCDTMYTLELIFEEAIMIPIDTMVCGESFNFRGVEYDDPLAEFPINTNNADGCDTTFLLSLQFSPVITSLIDTSICGGDVFTFKGVDYLFEESDLEINVPATDGGCDTTFFLTLSVEQENTIQTEVDPCIGQGSFRGINIASDTTIMVSGAGADCDTIFEVFYSPTVAPDSTFQDERCENNPLVINGVEYNPNNPTGSFDITTAEGCAQTVNVQIDFEAGVFKDLDTLLCEGSIVIVGNETFDADRTDGEVIFPEASSTGCDSVVFVSLEFIETVEFIQPVELCTGQSVTLFGVEVDENTTMLESYSIGPNLCDTLLRFDVSLRSISVTSGAVGSCANESNGSIELDVNDGQAPYTIDIEGEVTVSDSPGILLDNLAPGDYLINVTDADGCELTEVLTVDTSVFNIDFQNTQNDQGGLDLQVISDQNISSISWTPTAGLSCDDCTNPTANPDENTVYTVTAFDDKGCTQSINIEVLVNNNPTEEVTFYLPTAIAPRSPGNDIFFLRSQEGLVISYDMSIYNRYGEVMYSVSEAQPNVSDFGWNGRRSGNNLSPGVFVYHIVMRTIDGSTLIETGDVLVIH